jgi:hypothetical protein
MSLDMKKAGLASGPWDNSLADKGSGVAPNPCIASDAIKTTAGAKRSRMISVYAQRVGGVYKNSENFE